MNISAHLGALKIGTKIIIFKIHLDENCSENGNHVLLLDVTETVLHHLLECLRVIAAVWRHREIRDGNPVQKVCVSRGYSLYLSTEPEDMSIWRMDYRL